MLQELLNMVTGHAQEDIVNNPAIPNEKNNEAIKTTTDSILSGLQSAVAGGGLQSVLGMFTGGTGNAQNSGLMGNITNGVVDNLMNKIGLDNGIAKSVAHSLVPKILGSLVSNTQDPNNAGFNLNSLMGLLTSGNASNNQASGGFDFQNIITSAMSGGLDKNHDGKVDLGDVMGMVTGAASQQQSSGGGFGSLLSGLLGGK